MSSWTDSLTGAGLYVWWALVALGFLGSLLFPVLYHVGSRGGWRRSEMGRHLMVFSLAVGYALLALLSRITLGDYPGRGFVNFSAMIALVGAVWWRSFIYVKLRRKERNGRGRGVV